jgi:antitoxin (DNA-binding transcriptional repressor) of toxin-antitoxin stability system
VGSAARMSTISSRSASVSTPVAQARYKNRLSHYLRLVQQGEAVQVTDRGTVVAELRAERSPSSSDDGCLRALERQGLVTVGKKRLPDFAPLTPHGKKRLSEMVIEDRGDPLPGHERLRQALRPRARLHHHGGRHAEGGAR